MKQQIPRPDTFSDMAMTPPFERLMRETKNPQKAHAEIEKMLSDGKESLFTALNKV